MAAPRAPSYRRPRASLSASPARGLPAWLPRLGAARRAASRIYSFRHASIHKNRRALESICRNTTPILSILPFCILFACFESIFFTVLRPQRRGAAGAKNAHDVFLELWANSYQLTLPARIASSSSRAQKDYFCAAEVGARHVPSRCPRQIELQVARFPWSPGRTTRHKSSAA